MSSTRTTVMSATSSTIPSGPTTVPPPPAAQAIGPSPVSSRWSLSAAPFDVPQNVFASHERSEVFDAYLRVRSRGALLGRSRGATFHAAGVTIELGQAANAWTTEEMAAPTSGVGRIAERPTLRAAA